MSDSSLKRPILPAEQLVFVHIPKTAGTTLGTILNSHFRQEEICPILHMSDQLLDMSPEDFTPYNLIRGHYYYTFLAEVLTRPAVYITFLRDPVERALSHYGYLQDHAQIQRYTYGQGMDIEEFVFHPLTSLNILDLQTRMLGTTYRVHSMRDLRDVWNAQYMEALVVKSTDAQEAITVLDKMAFFGLAERFDESVALLAYTLGWPPVTRIEKQNIGQQRLRRDQVPPRVLRRIIELNQEDMKLYAHAQQVFAARYDRMLSELLAEPARPALLRDIPVLRLASDL